MDDLFATLFCLAVVGSVFWLVRIVGPRTMRFALGDDAVVVRLFGVSVWRYHFSQIISAERSSWFRSLRTHGLRGTSWGNGRPRSAVLLNLASGGFVLLDGPANPDEFVEQINLRVGARTG